MSCERPKRTRKIVNYGEDHLHWIEEAQLQKAFLRSLHDKDSPHKNSNNIKRNDQATPEKSSGPSSRNKIVLSDSSKSVESRSATQSSNIVVLEDIDNKDKHSVSISNNNEDMQLPNANTNSKLHVSDSCELRLTRLQSKLLEEAGMLYPDAEVVTASCQDKIEKKDTTLVRKVKESPSHSCPLKSNLSDIDDGSLTPRVRAQRKFASNTSPPQTRSNSPVKMHRRKVLFTDSNRKQSTRMPSKEKFYARGRAVRACSSENEKSDIVLIDRVQKKKKRTSGFNQTGHKNAPTSVFDGMPKTDNFLSFLCFRNTTLQVELQDCMD